MTSLSKVTLGPHSSFVLLCFLFLVYKFFVVFFQTFTLMRLLLMVQLIFDYQGALES